MCGSALLVIAPITSTAFPGGTGTNPAPIQVTRTVGLAEIPCTFAAH